MHNKGIEGEGGDHGNVFDGIKGRVLAEGCLCGIAARDQQQGVAIRLCLGHQIGAHTATCANFVVDHDGCSNRLGELLRNEARHDVS